MTPSNFNQKLKRSTFTEEELQAGTAFASYSELDELGRCGPAYGLVGAELQPTGEREPNDDIHPSGMRNTR